MSNYSSTTLAVFYDAYGIYFYYNLLVVVAILLY